MKSPLRWPNPAAIALTPPPDGSRTKSVCVLVQISWTRSRRISSDGKIGQPEDVDVVHRYSMTAHFSAMRPIWCYGSVRAMPVMMDFLPGGRSSRLATRDSPATTPTRAISRHRGPGFETRKYPQTCDRSQLRPVRLLVCSHRPARGDSRLARPQIEARTCRCRVRCRDLARLRI
jgi:hypothetical protein